MATITASSVSTTDSLETFRQQFNTLRGDIQGLSFGASVVFEGATADDFETTLAVTDPTADRTVTIQDKTGVLAMQGRDIDDVVVLNATDGSGTDEAGAILLNASASGVDEGEALLYEEGTNDHIVNPTFEEYEEFIILEESTENALVFLTRENTDESSVNARFAYQAATSDNLLGSLFIPPAAGGIQYVTPIADGNANQVLSTDGAGNLQFVNQSSGLSLNNDGNNRVITATGSNTGNGEANLLFDGSTLTVTGDITVDDINLNGKVVTITGDTSDTFTITTGAAGATTIATVDNAGTDGILTLDADGIIKLDAGDASGQIQLIGAGTQYGTIFHSNSGANLNIKSTVSDGDMNFVGNDGGSDIVALTFDMSAAGAATFNGNIKGGGYVWITTDAQKQFFGANAEIFIQHVHDVGLTLTNSSTGDNKPFVLQLKSEEDAIVADEVIASIELAAGDNSGTDAATVAAGIHAIAEGDFTSSANPTKLVFTTGVSETAAASATAKMTLSSAGLLTIADDFVIKDGGTIGSASDPDAIAIAADGVVTMNQIPVFSAGINVSGGSIAGTLSTAAQTNITSLGTLTALTVYNSSTPRIEVGYNGTQNHYLGWDGSKLHFQADPQNNNAASAILFSVDGSEAMRLAAGGIATFADDIKIKNGGTIGSASDADSITIASDGQVTLSQNLTITGEVTTTGFSSTDFAAAFIVIEDGGTDGSGTDAGDNLIDETDSDDLLMENVTSWVTSGFTIRDSFGNHLQTVNGVS
jgi:hypothetical protein